MANTLGSLVVKLGLDAAEFTSGLTKSEFQAKKFADSMSNNVATGIIKAKIAMELFAHAAEAAIHVIPDLIEQVAHFEQLGEKVGDSAAAFASMSASAKAGGIDMDTVGKASVKLSVGLAKISDDSQGAGAALKALGLAFGQFKTLSPSQQILEVSKALAGFQDDEGKAAVAVALFGRAGADMLPFLKQLSDGIGTVNFLTDDQIKKAHEFEQASARSKAQLQAFMQVLAVDAIPAISAVIGASKDLISGFLGISEASSDLQRGNVILDWAEAAAVAIAHIVDTAKNAALSIYAIAGSFQSVYADIKYAGQYFTTLHTDDLKKSLDERNKVVESANARYEALLNSNPTAASDAVKKNFDKQRAILNSPAVGGETKSDKPKINTSGLAKDSAGNAEALLKKQLDGQLKLIHLFAEQQKSGYEFANQYLKGVYEDGLTSQQDFFDKQKAIRDAALQGQLDAIDKELAVERAALSITKKPQDRQDIENKIADAIEKRASLQQKAGQANIIAAQEEERAVKQLAFAYYDYLGSVQALQGNAAGASSLKIAKQQQEARELLTKVGLNPQDAQSQSEAYGRLLSQTEALSRAQSDYGRLVDVASTKEKSALLDAQLSGQSEIDTLKQIGAIRQDALGGLVELVVKARELADALGTPDARLFADKLALQFKQAAIEADPLLQKVKDIGKEMGDAIGQNIEDALLAKGKTLRERFVGLVQGIADDVTKTLTKNLITKPIGDYLSGILGGNGTEAGGGGLLGPLFGASGGSGLAAQTAAVATNTTAMSALTAAATSAASALSSLAASSFGGAAGGASGLLSGFGTGDAFGNLDLGGFFATGGSAQSNTNYRVNERGPELLDVNGKSFLMMGSQRGRVIPLSQGGGSGGDTYIVNVQATPGMSAQQAMNQGRDIQRGMQVQAGRRARNT